VNDRALPPIPLPDGIRSRMVDGINGLTMHMLEAGTPGQPAVLLVHGFPELAYSWRKVMLPLAQAGFHVIAPDQRGYGRTTGWDPDYDCDLRKFSVLNLVRDALGLISALGLRSVAAVVGHDYGASVAAWCALVRPDVFRAVSLMSAPFAGPPQLPFDTAGKPLTAKAADPVHADLAALPRPRKHYQWFYSTREANDDMWKCPQGVHAFLRAYYHHKSADWPDNKPYALSGWTASELAKLPTYYVMDVDKGMAATVAGHMPTAEQIAACKWLTESELAFYAAEYGRNGFQGGLQSYRCGTSGRFISELEVFSGRTIDVPFAFISGASDWGIHQRPGALEAMQRRACTQVLGVHLIEGAGHWVQQEQPERVSELLLGFLREAAGRQ
jgi:pimeloyl-ACP methyl ester carboxylesterase